MIDEGEMDWRAYYLRDVYPRLNLPLAQYPLLSLAERAGRRPLGDHALVMLVGLTGTGKSTTLGLLRGTVDGLAGGVMPSRRELADWIAIPMAQALQGDPLAPVSDRVRRFAYTRTFAEHVPGGMAAAFSWLRLADDFAGHVLTEGLRGRDEIGFALNRFPRWQIIELTLNPVTRLRRLSARADDFDQTRGADDLSFLPRGWRRAAAALFKTGEISSKALAIVRAEAANYGFEPFPGGLAYPNYHQVEVEGRSPNEVAAALAGIIDEASCQG